MAIVAIENIRERSVSIIKEIKAKSIDGKRLGDLLVDMIDTMEDVQKNLDKNKVSVSDITSDANLPATTVGKVLDGRVYRQVMRKFDEYQTKENLAKSFKQSPLFTYKNGSVYQETEYKAMSSLIGVIVRDDTTGAIIRCELLPQKVGQIVELHTLLVNTSNGVKASISVKMEMVNGKKVVIYSPDGVLINNYTLELYTFI